MTLSQGIIKKWLLVFVLCFSMFFAFFPQSKASAASSRFLHVTSNTNDYFPNSDKTQVYINPGQFLKIDVDNKDYSFVYVEIYSGGKTIYKGRVYDYLYSPKKGVPVGYTTLYMSCGNRSKCNATGVLSTVN